MTMINVWKTGHKEWVAVTLVTLMSTRVAFPGTSHGRWLRDHWSSAILPWRPDS